MDPQAGPRSDGQIIRYQSRWGYRVPGPLWLIGLLVVPILFAAGATVVDRSQMEKSLTNKAVSALDKAGLEQIHVVFQARDATLEVPLGADVTQAELDRAEQLIAEIDGVRIVETGEISP